MEINGKKLHVEIHGRDIPRRGSVVLLHHGLGSVLAWKEQIPALVDAGYRVIAYDRWGYGRSDPRPGLSMPYFEDDLADLQALLDHLAISQAALVGHSDGATIALYFAGQHPERVICVVAAAAHIYVEPKMESGINAVRESYEADERFRLGLQRTHGSKAQAIFYNWYNGWATPENRKWDIRPELRRIRCPVLVVQGEEDEHATLQHAMDLAAGIDRSELWLVPGASHMLPQETAQEFNSKVLVFLGKGMEPKGD